MHLIIAYREDGEAVHFGPFTTEVRAREYGDVLVDMGWARYVLEPLIVPNCTVVTINNR